MIQEQTYHYDAGWFAMGFQLKGRYLIVGGLVIGLCELSINAVTSRAQLVDKIISACDGHAPASADFLACANQVIGGSYLFSSAALSVGENLRIAVRGQSATYVVRNGNRCGLLGTNRGPITRCRSALALAPAQEPAPH